MGLTGLSRARQVAGASVVEYVLLVAFIVASATGAVSFFGDEIGWRMAGGGSYGSVDPYFSGSPYCKEDPFRCRRKRNIGTGDGGGDQQANSSQNSTAPGVTSGGTGSSGGPNTNTPGTNGTDDDIAKFAGSSGPSNGS